MDPGNVLAIASLAYEGTKDLYKYYEALKDYDQDIARPILQLSWLRKAIKVTRNTLLTVNLSKQSMELVYRAMQGCNDATDELRKMLKKIQSDGEPHIMLEKVKDIGRKAFYPFQKSTIASIGQNLDSYEQAFQLAIWILDLNVSSEVLNAVKALDREIMGRLKNFESSLDALDTGIQDLKTTTTEIQKTISSSQDKEYLHSVLVWLSQTDYSSQLQDDHSRHSSGTGQWFLDSTEFQTWLTGADKTLYCPGHPGMGEDRDGNDGDLSPPPKYTTR
jgi:hypothetical protein